MTEFRKWRTSTRTQGQGQCVEVGFGDGGVGVRDSKNRAAGHFTVAPRLWGVFVDGLKRDAFRR